jgi:hypothetical protein
VTSSARLLALVVGGFVLASVANVFWETQVVPDTAYDDRIIVSRDDGRLVTLVASTRAVARERFLMATALLELASGGTLRVPNATLVDVDNITYLSRIALEVDDYRSELTGAEVNQLLGFVRFEGTGLIAGPESTPLDFYIVLGPGDPGRRMLTLLFHEGAAFVVDDDLLQGVSP